MIQKMFYCKLTNSTVEAESLLTFNDQNSLNLAKEKSFQTITYPLIFAGVYDYPQREEIQVIIETIKLYLDDFDEITLLGECEFGFM